MVELVLWFDHAPTAEGRKAGDCSPLDDSADQK
jgi:hypothetical protein